MKNKTWRPSPFGETGFPALEGGAINGKSPTLLAPGLIIFMLAPSSEHLYRSFLLGKIAPAI